MPARKKARKSTRKTRRKAGRARPKRLTAVAVGEAVRIPVEAPNLITRYDPARARGARGAEAIEGIVLSIRKIASGQLVAKTTGDLSGFVLEIVHNQTFRPYLSSDKNTGGPRGPEQVTANPAWMRLRELLREMVESKQLVSAASEGLSKEPLRSLLDGWRVVKVKAQHIEAATEIRSV